MTILGTGGGSGEVAAIVRRQATTEDPSGTALTAPMDESSDDEVEVPWNKKMKSFQEARFRKCFEGRGGIL